MEKEQIRELISKAFEAQKRAYIPYSGYAVGAALLSKKGEIFQGCNIENASYTPTNCAERTAFFKAVSEGEKEFRAIAVVGSKAGEKPSFDSLCTPCGVCRQVMREFCNPKEFQVILAVSEEEYKIFLLEELLPMGFGPEYLI